MVEASSGQVDATMNGIAERFAALGILFEITHPAGQAEVESLGLQFNFGSRVFIRNKTSRAWRLYLSTKAILKRKRVSGDLLRVWLGHTNFFFQLSRLGLSCPSAVYKFSAMHLGRRAPMWPNVRRELRQIMGLVFLVEHELTAPRSETVHLGDSSTYGFARMFTKASSAEIGKRSGFERSGGSWGRLDERAAILGDDEEAMSDLHSYGHSAQPSLGVITGYGRELRQRMESSEPRKMRAKKQQLFGSAKSRLSTLMEAVSHPPVRDVWHESSRWTLISSGGWSLQKSTSMARRVESCLAMRRVGHHPCC